MLNAKQAVTNAIEAVRELYAPEKLNKVLPDEVQLSDSGRYWLVTLNFTPESGGDNLGIAPPNESKSRLSKVIKIDAENGQLVAMNPAKK